MACQDLTPGLAPSQHPCMYTPALSSPIAVYFNLAINMPVPGVSLGFASVFAKDGRLYTPPTPWQAFENGLGCTLLQHPTSPALLTSPTPCKREFVCGACIGTAQIGASLVVPLGFIFKQSSLRSLRDMIIIYKERKKQFHEYFIHKNMTTTSGTHSQGLVCTVPRYATIPTLTCYMSSLFC